ncbi:hypothetical protein DV735_g5404, partial [Chaetothyriales sp. CBS 134920]
MPSRPDKPALSQAYISDSGEEEKTENNMTKRRRLENKALKVKEKPHKRTRQEEDGAEEDQQSKRQKNRSTRVSTESSSSKLFVPPKGFKPLVLDSSDLDTESSEMFSALDAKQVWHICAPASVNVAAIKELDLEAVLRGEAILSENGVSYSMQEMQADSSLVLMKGSSGIYRPSRAKVARSFRLAVKAGGSSGPKASSAPAKDVPVPTFVAQSPGQKKPPRKQPEVLGMKYLPFGAETKAQAPVVGTSSAPQQSPAQKKRTLRAKDIAIEDPMLSPSPSPIPRSSKKSKATKTS